MGIIDGRELSKELRLKLKEKIIGYNDMLGISPKLVVVIVGDNAGAISYTRGIEKMAKLAGVCVEVSQLSSEITEEDFLVYVNELNDNNEVNGVLVMMPLPIHIDSNKVFETIDPVKDIDGLNALNIGNFYKQRFHHPASTPTGIDLILKEYGVEIEGKDACVVGASLVVGRPMAEYLLRENATVTVCHKYTKDLASHTKKADILVVAVGYPNLIKPEMVKDGAVVIDVGVNMVKGKLCGDCDYDGIKEKASLITPVPGGVGPMTIAQTFISTVKAFEKMHNLM